MIRRLVAQFLIRAAPSVPLHLRDLVFLGHIDRSSPLGGVERGGLYAVVVYAAVLALGCGVLLRRFETGANRRSHAWFRWFNEAPVILMLLAVVLVVVKPF